MTTAIEDDTFLQLDDTAEEHSHTQKNWQIWQHYSVWYRAKGWLFSFWFIPFVTMLDMCTNYVFG